MTAQWYVQIGGRQLGPYSGQQLKQFAAKGQIRPETLVKQSATGSWATAAQVRGLFSPPPPPQDALRAVPTPAPQSSVGDEQPGTAGDDFYGALFDNAPARVARPTQSAASSSFAPAAVKKKPSIGMIIGSSIGGVAAFAIAWIVAFQLTNGVFGGGKVEKQLQEVAATLSKQLPMQADAFTRCDRIEAGPGKQLSYHYTISHSPNAVQKQQIKEKVRTQCLAQAEMKPMFDAGVVFRYCYYDTGGEKVLEFTVQR